MLLRCTALALRGAPARSGLRRAAVALWSGPSGSRAFTRPSAAAAVADVAAEAAPASAAPAPHAAPEPPAYRAFVDFKFVRCARQQVVVVQRRRLPPVLPPPPAGQAPRRVVFIPTLLQSPQRICSDNVEAVAANCAARLSCADPQRVATLYEEYVAAQQETDRLRAARNENSGAMKVGIVGGGCVTTQGPRLHSVFLQP